MSGVMEASSSEDEHDMDRMEQTISQLVRIIPDYSNRLRIAELGIHELNKIINVNKHNNSRSNILEFVKCEFYKYQISKRIIF